MFGLISKSKLRREIADKSLLVYGSQGTLRRKYTDGDLTEWTFYKKLWASNGRLRAYNDLLDRLE